MANTYPRPSQGRNGRRQSPAKRVPPARGLPPGRRAPGRKPPSRLPVPKPRLPATRLPMPIRLPLGPWPLIIGGMVIAGIHRAGLEVFDPAGQGWAPGAYCSMPVTADGEVGATNWLSCVHRGVGAAITLYSRSNPPTTTFQSWEWYEPWYPYAVYKMVRWYSPPNPWKNPWRVEPGSTVYFPAARPWPELQPPLAWPYSPYPELLPLPVGQPLPFPGHVPFPLVPKLPDIDPHTGEPVRGPVPEPPPGAVEGAAPGPTITLGPSVSVRPGQSSFPRPPSRGEKETPKRKWKSGALYRVVNKALGHVTEGMDFVQCLQKSMPAKYRAKPVWVDGPRPAGNPFQRPGARGKTGYRWTPRGWEKRDGYYRAPSMPEVTEAIYRNVQHIDVDKLIQCLAANAVEDFVLGRLGQMSAEGSRRIGRPYGFQTGPAL